MSGTGLRLVVPMAGRGSRFRVEGVQTPKPLVVVQGRPLFEWAVRSVLASTDVAELVVVVLEQHVRESQIDVAVVERFPEARLVVLPDTPNGSALSCLAGARAVQGSGPVAFADSDQAFSAPTLRRDVGRLAAGEVQGLVPWFRADSPAYSYGVFDAGDRLTGIAEKQVVSERALAGLYAFSGPEEFARLTAVAEDATEPGQEVYLSQVVRALLAEDATVLGVPLAWHAPYGTPAEVAEHHARPELPTLLPAAGA